MPLNITFADFDTVCYSTQYNIMQLIKHCVGITVQVNVNESSINNVFGQVNGLIQEVEDLIKQLEELKGDIGNTDGDVNSLVLKVNELQRTLEQHIREYNTFSYAVVQDINSLTERVRKLEEKV